MKILNHPIVLIFTIAILLFACNIDENPPMSHCDIWECHHQVIWDSLSTEATLTGEWEWEYISCFWDQENANNEDFKGMTIEFKSDHTLNVKENGQMTQSSNWKVVKGDANLFAIDVDPAVSQLYGRILFCGERVEFNDSYIDGCDNYFKRKE